MADELFGSADGCIVDDRSRRLDLREPLGKIGVLRLEAGILVDDRKDRCRGLFDAAGEVDELLGEVITLADDLGQIVVMKAGGLPNVESELPGEMDGRQARFHQGELR